MMGILFIFQVHSFTFIKKKEDIFVKHMYSDIMKVSLKKQSITQKVFRAAAI
jgi:hypothetical protein